MVKIPAPSTGGQEGLTYRDGRLHWYGCDLLDVADRFGTPCHVGAADAVAAAFRQFTSPFSAHGLSLDVRFSVKSNPVPVYLDALYRLGAGFEVGSLFELDLLRRLAIPPDRIVVSGLRDGAPLVLKAAELGVEIVTVTTSGQLDSLGSAARRIGSTRPLKVSIGICPGLTRARWDTTLSSSSSSSPVGFPSLSPELDRAMDTVAAEPSLHLCGLHMHIGSGIRTATPFAAALRVAEKVIRRAADRGHRLTVLDGGGGFGSSTAPVKRPLSVVASLLSIRDRPANTTRTSLQLAGVASATADFFRRLRRDGLQPERFLLEPGRLLSGPTQLLLLTVTDVVDRGGDLRFLLCDGGAMSISPLLVIENHRVEPLLDRGGPRRAQRVSGSFPTALDRVAPAVLLPEMVPGDRVAVLDTGAYAVSMNNTFNGPRPPIVWIGAGVACLAQRRETVDDLRQRDVLPAPSKSHLEPLS